MKILLYKSKFFGQQIVFLQFYSSYGGKNLIKILYNFHIKPKLKVGFQYISWKEWVLWPENTYPDKQLIIYS